MNEPLLAGGSEFQLVVWVVVGLIWGVGQLIARAAKKKQEAPKNASSRTKKSDLRDMLEEIKKAALKEMTPAQPAPHPVAPARPERVQQTVAKKHRVSVAREASAEPIKISSLGKQEAFEITRMPSMTMASQKSSMTDLGRGGHMPNPLRPAWKNKADVRKAFIASIIFQPHDLSKFS